MMNLEKILEGFNPLKSGRFCNEALSKLNEKVMEVSIPLNRVGFVIVKSKTRAEYMVSFNPLKSGRFCNYKRLERSYFE